MSVTADCLHLRVAMIYAEPNGRWSCVSCGELFVPQQEAYESKLEGWTTGYNKGQADLREHLLGVMANIRAKS